MGSYCSVLFAGTPASRSATSASVTLLAVSNQSLNLLFAAFSSSSTKSARALAYAARRHWFRDHPYQRHGDFGVLTNSFTAVPGLRGSRPLKMTDVRDASSGKKAFWISATGIEFRGRLLSESIGDGGEPTGASSGASSKTGVTSEVIGSGIEYGLGRANSVGSGLPAAKVDNLD